jgi:hypothetical protein
VSMQLLNGRAGVSLWLKRRQLVGILFKAALRSLYQVPNAVDIFSASEVVLGGDKQRALS